MFFQNVERATGRFAKNEPAQLLEIGSPILTYAIFPGK